MATRLSSLPASAYRVTQVSRPRTVGRLPAPREPWNPQPGIGMSAARALGQFNAPAAPAVPAPAGPAPTVAQPDPVYRAAINSAALNRDVTLAGLQGERTRGLQDYGYTAQFDPSGALDPGSLQFDPNNPFSRAALLARSYNETRRGNTTSMAARGQLYSGALVNAQDRAGLDYQRGNDQLVRALIAFLAQNNQAQAQAGVGYQTAAAQALGESTARAATNPLYDPAAAAAAATPAAPAARVVVRPSVAHGGARWRYRVGASGRLIPIGPA